MAQLTIQTIARTGINLTDLAVAADAAGDKWANSGQEFIAVINSGGSAVTVTLNFAATLDGQSATNRTVSVPAGKTMFIGPFPQSLYNDSAGNAEIDYSAVTSVKVSAFKQGAFAP